MLLQRQSAGSQALLRDGFDSTIRHRAEVFNAKDLRFDVPGGFNLSIAQLSTYGWDLEVNYTHIDSFQATRAWAGTSSCKPTSTAAADHHGCSFKTTRC